jgi:hypothetical protein
MAEWQMGTTAAEIYSNMLPAQYAEEETDYALARFLDALSHLLDPVADVTRPPPAWDKLASPYRCPPQWLPVLAQWAGVSRADAYTNDQDGLRDLLATGGPAFWRGTRKYFIAQVRRWYAPDWQTDPPLFFQERADGDPYRLRMFIYRWVELTDEVALRRRLWEIKPAGLQPIEFEIRDGQIWWQARNCGHTYWQIHAAFANWHDFLNTMADPGAGYECREAPPTPPLLNPQTFEELALCLFEYWQVRTAFTNWRDVRQTAGPPAVPCRIPPLMWLDGGSPGDVGLEGLDGGFPDSAHIPPPVDAQPGGG